MYLSMATQTSLYENDENHFDILMKLLHVYSLVRTALAKKHLQDYCGTFFLRCSKKIWKTYVAI